MAELAGYAGVLRAVNWIYWILVAGAILWAWHGPAVRRDKVALTVLVSVAVLALPAVNMYHIVVGTWKFHRAKAVFEERCKTARESISHQFAGVEGLMLMKIRSYSSGELQHDRNALGEMFGDDYIKSFLRDVQHDGVKTAREGFRFVEAFDIGDGRRYRYELGPQMALARREATGPPPQFGIDFDDPVEDKDRYYWIATDTIKVVDLSTRQTIAYTKRFAFEPGLGSRAGQRVPWLFARGCGLQSKYPINSTRLFVEKVFN